MPKLGNGAIYVLSALAFGFACAPTYGQTFTYDELGRVVTASYSDNTKIRYCYDNVGNRTVYQVATGSTVSCAPVANNVTQSVIENSSSNSINLVVTGEAPTSVAVSTAASHGTATASGTAITYTPTSGYAGADSFQYTATDSSGTSAPATATINVIPGSGVTLFSQTTVGSYSYTVPVGVTLVGVETWGGGGGGGDAANVVGSHGGGGGGGGYSYSQIAVTPGTVLTGTVGAGGIGQSSIIVPTAGGNTTMTTPPITAPGGGAGAADVGGNGGIGATTNGAAGSNTGAGGLAGNTTSSPPGGGGTGTVYNGNAGAGAAGQIIIVNLTTP